ncbi:hypothetical protein SLS62_002227 [Diatrype stigma]|uniref:Oxidoreductase n=1 Tax=Diatrype stigma TaxID=117547 RepID=A0AAN9V8T3_9PEZI
MAVDNGGSEKTAQLAVVNYEALANKDDSEVKKLVQAAKTVGMFYLDLRGPKTQAIFGDLPQLFKTGQEFFKLPEDSDEKVQSLREGLERGYHPGKGLAYYEIARDEFTLGKWVFPATLEPQKELITRMLETLNDAVQTVLAELCAGVDIQIPELKDDPTIPSDTGFKLLYKAPVHDAGNVVVPAHTDFGLITLLWYDEVTTQLPVYDEDGKETGEWVPVPVVEGSVLINVADDLAKRSGGRLHSTLHRVIAPPGPKRMKNGLIYLLRPHKA